MLVGYALVGSEFRASEIFQAELNSNSCHHGTWYRRSLLSGRRF